MNWKRAGEAVRQRRLELNLTIEQAAALGHVSASTWGKVEKSRDTPHSERSKRGIARALEWPPDAIDRLAAGEDIELTLTPEATAHDLATHRNRLDAILVQVREALEAVDDEIRRRQAGQAATGAGEHTA